MNASTGFARLGKDRISYRVTGHGPVDVVMTWGAFASFDALADDPTARVFYSEIAASSRIIQFDRRGTGGSDPVPLDSLPPLESHVEEVVAVMDAVGSERAVVMASYNAGAMALLLAASRPERVEGLVLYNTTARYLWAPDYEAGVPEDVAEQLLTVVGDTWGTEAHAAFYVPSKQDDPDFLAWFAKMLRASVGPTAAQANFRNMFATDVRSLLPSIQVPTLVLHRKEFGIIPVAQGRHIAAHVAGARFVELPGADAPMIWEGGQEALGEIETFIAGARQGVPPARMLATVLFTDIVDSTVRARELGDRRWRWMLGMHDEVGERVISRHQGRLISKTGDGLLAVFDGPGRAIRCGLDIQAELDAVGLAIRIGIHSGEIELRDEDIGGLAVHLAARVMAAAQPGELLVSRTVRDLVAGSDFQFLDRGAHRLKGIEGEWHLYSIRLDRPGVLASR